MGAVPVNDDGEAAGPVAFLECPAYQDQEGHLRCGLPAVVEARYATPSTSGPLESAVICCPRRHRCHGPVEFLAVARRSPPIVCTPAAGAG